MAEEIDPRYLQPLSDPKDEKLRQQYIKELMYEKKKNYEIRRQNQIQEHKEIIDRMMNDQPREQGIRRGIASLEQYTQPEKDPTLLERIQGGWDKINPMPLPVRLAAELYKYRKEAAPEEDRTWQERAIDSTLQGDMAGVPLAIGGTRKGSEAARKGLLKNTEYIGNLKKWMGEIESTKRDAVAKETIPQPLREEHLRRLSAQTEVRQNPDTKETEFLLHRFHNPSGPTLIDMDTSSWTPRKNVAENFAGYNSEVPVMSRWIPASKVISMPYLLGEKSLKNFGAEREVLVKKLDLPEILLPADDAHIARPYVKELNASIENSDTAWDRLKKRRYLMHAISEEMQRAINKK